MKSGNSFKNKIEKGGEAFGTRFEKVLFLLLALYVGVIWFYFDFGAFQNEKAHALKSKLTKNHNEKIADFGGKNEGAPEEINKITLKLEKILYDIEEPLRDLSSLRREKILVNKDASLVCVKYILDGSAKDMGLEFAVYGTHGLRRGSKHWSTECDNKSLHDFTNFKPNT